MRSKGNRRLIQVKRTIPFAPRSGDVIYSGQNNQPQPLGRLSPCSFSDCLSWAWTICHSNWITSHTKRGSGASHAVPNAKFRSYKHWRRLHGYKGGDWLSWSIARRLWYFDNCMRGPARSLLIRSDRSLPKRQGAFSGKIQGESASSDAQGPCAGRRGLPSFLRLAMVDLRSRTAFGMGHSVPMRKVDIVLLGSRLRLRSGSNRF